MPAARLLLLPALAAAALVLAACSAGGGGGGKGPADAGDSGTVDHGSGTATKAPTKIDTSKLDACTILPQPDAETLIGTTLIDPLKVSTSDVASCTYQSDPNGPVGQVEIYVGDGAKQQLDIDKDKLQHAFTQPSGLGDEAWQEDEMIWARSGPTWVSIRIVSLDDAAAFVQPLQTAMTTALANLKAA
jgi:hypothetical protein